jgi:photosystem II stability/assembly factor-like uncharacterized protein
MRGIRKMSVTGAVTLGLALGGAATAAAVPVSVGHSGWTWGSPTPQGKDLNAVTFSGATGYAVGAAGTALRSIDGGTTWTGLPTGTFSNLSVVEQLDANTIVAGGGCDVVETSNGGATFTRLAFNPTPYDCSDNVSGLSFSSVSTGYAEETGGEVLFTTDGGQSVAPKTPVPLPPGDQVVASGLQFVSPTTGFSVTGGGVGGTIQRTTDGANSWTQVGSSTRGLNALTFVNPTTAFAVGDKGTLLESTDGGATWTTRPLALPPGTAVPDLEHISCSDTLNCLISAADSRSLIRTTDGGLTGSTVTPSSQMLSDVAFSTGTDVVGVGSNGATVLSTNGGAQFPTMISGGSQMPVSDSAGAPLRAGGAVGDAYLLGQKGQIEATTNGGASWTVLRTPSNGDLVDVAFPSAVTGYAVTDDDVLRKTANGGGTWSSLDAGVSDQTTLAAPSAGVVLLIGPHGIRRSTNGGQDFTKVGGTVVEPSTGKGKHKRTPKGPKVSSLAVGQSLTVGHTVFAYSDTHAYESTNGGAVWRAVPLPTRTKIDQLSFVTATTGYVLDQKGDPLVTHNRGATWTKLFTLGTDVQAISFANASDGLAVLPVGAFSSNFGGDVLATTNGGKSWQPEAIDSERGGLALATPGHDYFADPSSEGQDDTSAVFSTTDNGLSPQASHLSITIGAKTLTAAALKKEHSNRVTVKGRLSPVTRQGENVLVADRTPSGSWTHQVVNVATSGAFQVTVKNIKSTTDFVVLAEGDGVHGGAEGYARLTVK